MVLALTGSINCIKHLQATAVEAGLDLDVYKLFEEQIPRIPVLCAVRPNGDTSIEELEAGGGARAVLKQLGDLVDGSALTVTGKTVAREPRRLSGPRQLARARRAMRRSPPSPASSSCAARWRPTAASSRWG